MLDWNSMAGTSEIGELGRPSPAAWIKFSISVISDVEAVDHVGTAIWDGARGADVVSSAETSRSACRCAVSSSVNRLNSRISMSSADSVTVVGPAQRQGLGAVAAAPPVTSCKNCITGSDFDLPFPLPLEPPFRRGG
eukprot:SAG31_NODE_4045_length_3640_cov_3.520474_2_plen_137_part_00